MSVADAVAIILLTGVVIYACSGGADFGAGAWDLTAGGARRGAAMRSLIDRAIGPVWEANHVWLIFVLVFLWTGFPIAFASIMETLYIPFCLAGLGIVLRGAAFVFRKFAPTLAQARLFGAFFATSSVVTPFFFGTIVGAIASGRVPYDHPGDAWSSWTGPTSMAGGALAVLTCAFLAAVFLTAEAAREGDHALVMACRRRAVTSGVVTGVAALALLVPLSNDAPTLYDGLTGGGLPLIVASGIGGISAMAALVYSQYAIARAGAVVAVVSVVAGWGVAQYPWMLVDSLKIEAAAGAPATMWALVATFGIAAVTVIPALAYLFWVTQQPTWVEDKAHH